jgi:menaquinol-cytochrome c reductase iron-sulfur subunit
MSERIPDDDAAQSSRRQFLAGATGVLIAVCGAAVGVPLVGSFIGPAGRSLPGHWLKAASLRDLPAGNPVSLRVIDVQEDAYLRQSVIRHLWVIKHSDTQVTVFSPTCPHLGCRFNWNDATRRFECPCHGSIYAPDGKVLGGPAPRPLDTLATRIESGSLSVNWQQFRSGTAEKIPV